MLNLHHQSSLTLRQTHQAVLLKRCAKCHAPHPAARRPPPADLSVCPDCGFAAARAQIREGKGKLIDPILNLGDAFLRIGAFFHKLSEKL